MARKAAASEEKVGRVGQRRQVVIPRKLFERLRVQEGDFVAFSPTKDGVLIRPKRMVDPDDVLTREESAIIARARREMREGKYVTLTQLDHELGRKRPPRRRKTA